MTLEKTHYILALAALCFFSSCSIFNKATDNTEVTLDDHYSNTEYGISFQLPSSWMVTEEPLPDTQEIVINLFKEGTGAEEELPLHVHADAEHSYIAILPHGLGTELPNSQYTSFDQESDHPDLSFEIDASKSTILQLKDGSHWAYFIDPAAPPGSWSDWGFIFAQIQTEEHQLYCLDPKTGERKSANQCNYAQGDEYIREGIRNEQDAAVIQAVLESLSLEQIEEQEAASNMIEVEQPLPDQNIRSPLTIRGEAKGYWYFEGTFVAKLYDASDNLLAEQPVEAQDHWTTEDFVPFEATIPFDAPDDQRGRLVLERANPSGLPENDQSYAIPVNFSPR